MAGPGTGTGDDGGRRHRGGAVGRRCVAPRAPPVLPCRPCGAGGRTGHRGGRGGGPRGGRSRGAVPDRGAPPRALAGGVPAGSAGRGGPRRPPRRTARRIPGLAGLARPRGDRGPRWRWPPCPPTGPEPDTRVNGARPLPVRGLLARTVALRWAARNGVPAVACDLPLADRAWARAATPGPAPGAASAPVPGEGLGLSTALRSAHRPDGARPVGPAGGDPGARFDTSRRSAVPPCSPAGPCVSERRGARAAGAAHDRPVARRACAATSPRGWRDGRRPAVVVGAFHTPALLPATRTDRPERRTAGSSVAPDPAAGAGSRARASTPTPLPGGRLHGLLIPRHVPSSTPLRLPGRHPGPGVAAHRPGGRRDPAAIHEALVRTAVRLCAALREQGHPYGPADGREIVRVAGDLARLRDLPAPGRGELLEAVQTVLGRGET